MHKKEFPVEKINKTIRAKTENSLNKTHENL